MTISSELVRRITTVVVDTGTSHAVARALVDWTGCALAGSHHAVSDVLIDALDLDGDRGCTIVGRSRRGPVRDVAMVNGAASHVHDYDDVNTRMIGHPAVVVMPAALALGESRRIDGRTFVAGVTAGYEVAERLGRILNPSHYERGWHATATIGCAAAAATSAVVLGLEPDGIGRSLSLAVTQAGGLRAMFGSHGKAIHAGRAAQAGVLAGQLAAAGAEVPGDVLAGRGGYVAMTSASDSSTGRENRSDEPAIMRTAFKGHAACGATHCLIDAVAGLVRDHGLDPDEITGIQAQVHPLAVEAASITEPRTGLEAKFSLPHLAAYAAFRYPLRLDAFEDGQFSNERIVSLRDRVSIEVDPELEYGQAMPARVTVTAGGRRFDRHVETPRGRPDNPMSDDELAEKFRGLALSALGERQARSLESTLWEVADLDDVAPLAEGMGR